MTDLTADNIRRLDALNLIEAFTNDQPDVRKQIAAVYARASLEDNGLSSFELAHCCAHLASLALQHIEDADELIAKCRQQLLDDDEAP
jgi:hypothetical protein